MSKSLKEKAKIAVENIILDLSDRSGMGNDWDATDKDIKDEIKKTWADIIVKQMSK